MSSQGRHGLLHDESGIVDMAAEDFQIMASSSDGAIRFAHGRKRARSKSSRRTMATEPLNEKKRGGTDSRKRKAAGKRAIVVFQIFGDNFLFLDRQDQTSSALDIGRVLGTIPSVIDALQSLTLLFTFAPGSKEDISADQGEKWSPDALRPNASVITSRNCYVVARFSKSEDLDRQQLAVRSALASSGLTLFQLRPDEAVSVMTFGINERTRHGFYWSRANWSHCMIGQRVMRVLDVVDLPKGEVGADFLAPLILSIDSQSILSFRFIALDNRYALRKIRSKRSGVTADAGIRTLLGFLSRNSDSAAMESLARQEVELDLGFEMFSVSGRAAVYADDIEELNRLSKNFQSIAERNGLLLECSYGKQLKGKQELLGSVSPRGR